MRSISEEELAAARKAWGEALIALSLEYEEHGLDRARKMAQNVVDTIYGYSLGPVLFKPTLASGEQTFRRTRGGAVSYFVGHDPDYPLDVGFGLLGWREMATQTSAHFVEGEVGLWMGWVSLTNKLGEITKVDKTFGYKRDAEGQLRIILHHSSLPYQP